MALLITVGNVIDVAPPQDDAPSVAVSPTDSDGADVALAATLAVTEIPAPQATSLPTWTPLPSPTLAPPTAIPTPTTISESSVRYVGCQLFDRTVDLNARAPSKAEKQQCAFRDLVDNGDSYTMRGYIDGQNGFGATVRVVVQIEFVKNGNEWRVIDADFFE